MTDAHVSGGAAINAFGDVTVSASETRSNENALDLGYGQQFTTGDAVDRYTL